MRHIIILPKKNHLNVNSRRTEEWVVLARTGTSYATLQQDRDENGRQQMWT
jgi:hypothetical protein